MGSIEFEIRKMDRMAEDAARIAAPHLWPRDPLPVKSQPWAMKNGYLRTGVILSTDLLTVRLHGGTACRFGSMTELVEEWSVD
jgi:hypothetical protein